MPRPFSLRRNRRPDRSKSSRSSTVSALKESGSKGGGGDGGGGPPGREGQADRRGARNLLPCPGPGRKKKATRRPRVGGRPLLFACPRAGGENRALPGGAPP